MQQFSLIMGQDVSGKNIEVNVYRFVGTEKNASKTYIQSSIHGAEVQGNLVVYNLIKYFKQHPPKGDVTLIPHCNPIGGNHKVGEYTHGRFDPITGDNWNRQYFNPGQKQIQGFAKRHKSLSSKEIVKKFREYLIHLITIELAKPYQLSRGERIAYNLQKFAYEADHVIDLHTDSYATRYIYIPSYAVESAKNFGFPHLLTFDNRFGGAMDEAITYPWWTLKEALQENGYEDFINPIESFTMELGSQEYIKTQQAQQDTNCILKYMQAKDTINPNSSLNDAACTSMVHHVDNMISFNAPVGGLYEFNLKPGEFIKKDGVFATCLQSHTQEIISLYAPCDGYLVSQQCSSAIPQGVRVAKFFKT